MRFIVNIANKNIFIDSIYKGIYDSCKDYMVGESVSHDIEIIIDENMLAEEYEQIKREKRDLPGLQTIEKQLVHRKMAEALIFHNTILIHGAVITLHNKAFMFTAPSGTGKTTHIQKWIESVEGTSVVNGDKPFVIINEEGAFACGTPWCGKENLGTNAIVSLQSIVFMERSEDNRIEKVEFKSIFPNLLEQTFRPVNADAMKKTLNLLLGLKNKVTFYKFYCNNYKEDNLEVSYNTLIL